MEKAMDVIEMVEKQSSEMPIEDLKMILNSLMAATTNSIFVSFHAQPGQLLFSGVRNSFLRRV